jgi:multidrug efflux pump subunit AcrA (membrane-fusion protein)
MNKTVKWILISVVALLTVFLTAKAVMKKGKDGEKVTAEIVKRRTITETVSASGKLFPETEIKLGSPISGEVTQLDVHEGDTVTKGQVLARIQGEKGAAAQRITLPNVPPGFEGLVRNMQPPATSTGPSSAVIKAPISGTVIALNVKKGERTGAMQMPGSEMMRIADMNNIEVRVDVNENNIIKISIGDSADVEIEAYNKRKFKGMVTSIANGGTKRDAQSFLSNDVTNYEVHIRLLPSSYADLFDSNRRSMPFRPGMNARAEIKTKRKENVLSIPVGAVVSKAKGSDDASGTRNEKAANDEQATDETAGTDDLQEVVYVIQNDGTVQRRTVTTGIQDINYFEITGGLKEGEKVVTAPYNTVSKTLRSGRKVEVVSKEQLFQNE